MGLLMLRRIFSEQERLTGHRYPGGLHWHVGVGVVQDSWILHCLLLRHMLTPARVAVVAVIGWKQRHGQAGSSMFSEEFNC